MLKPAIHLLAPLLLLVGCSTGMHNPIDRITYRNEPLVREVEDGMSQQRVLRIAGEPSAVSPRHARPGLCHDYILNRDGRQQTYHVSFDAAGQVDGRGFTTCRQLEERQRR